MYPKVCPVCKHPEQHAGRGFEHISMFLRGQGQGTVYLLCAHCHSIFPWHYGEPHLASGVDQIAEAKNNSKDKREQRKVTT